MMSDRQYVDLRSVEKAVGEPTAEMVAAGVAVLWASGAIEGRLGSDRILVSEIFQAMDQARGPPRGKRGKPCGKR